MNSKIKREQEFSWWQWRMLSAYTWEISTGEQVKNGGNQQRAAGDAFNDIKGENTK